MRKLFVFTAWIGAFVCEAISDTTVDRRGCAWLGECRWAFDHLPPYPSETHSTACSSTLERLHRFHPNLVEDTSDRRCASVNVIDVGGNRTLALAAAPKCGSTTLRDRIMRHSFKAYLNNNGIHKGEENGWFPCEKIESRFGPLLSGTSSVTAALFVREPLSRFISGVREVHTNHRGNWAWFYSLKILRRATVDAAFTANKTLPEIIELYLESTNAGYFNIHTAPLAVYGSMPPWMARHKPAGWDAFVRIEHPEDWKVLVSALDLRQLPGVLEKANAKESTGALGDLLTPRSWDLFCSMHSADYACLNYDLPAECESRNLIL